MGANAQTSVPAFTAGQVLTAAQVTQINTGIPVFASSTERDAAFGGTGEKTLAEGQMAYLEDTNETQYYDGSSWDVVGGAGALVRVGGGTLSGASTTVSNVFSATYDAYKLVFSDLSFSATGWATFKFGASTTGYYAGGPGVQYSGSASNYNLNNAASIANFVYSASVTGATTIEVINPFLAKNTAFHYPNFQFITTGIGGYFAGFLNDTTSYTDFTVAVGAGTLTGTVNVYGYSLT